MSSGSIWPPAPVPASIAEVVVERDVSIPMSDGTRIIADVHRPADLGSHPALFAISPYQKDFAHLPPIPVFRWRESGDIDWWVRHGYVFVHADSRGAGKSLPGDWRVLDRREQEDLHDTIEWIAEQPWCTGRVGMTGESYYAVVQWLAAAQQPPHLACIAPYDGWIDPYRDLFFHGGMPTMGFTTWWLWDVRARMLLDRPGPHDRDVMRYDFIDDLLRHPCHDEFWSERSAHEKLDRIQVPVYSMSNWTMVGIHLRANLIAYEELGVPKKLLVGSGDIGGDSQRFYHSEALHTELLRFFDHWLKDADNGIMDEPPIKLFVRNGDGFREENEWPLARTEWTPIYLRPESSGTATSRNDGTLSWEPPADGTPPTSHAYPDERWGGWPILGPAARSSDGQIDRLANILTFTSEPVGDALEVTGPIVVRLWMSSDQTDTDVIVSLMDVAPDGSPPRRVTRGWLRASHRAIDPARSRSYRPFHDHRRAEPLRPGEIFELEIEVWPTSWVFLPGHRIRIEVSNADSPMFDNPINHHYGVKVGRDTLHHDAEHPSHVVLPVIPTAT
jgi:uncharacterized protein